MLLELPRAMESGLPTRVHLFYNRLPKADALRADSLIASIRCCLRTEPATAKPGAKPGR